MVGRTITPLILMHLMLIETSKVGAVVQAVGVKVVVVKGVGKDLLAVEIDAKHKKHTNQKQN
jgi:hypothetical protein